MTIAMKPSTYRGNAINDHINYLSCLLPTAYGGLPGVNMALGKRSGAWPLISAIERPGRDLTLQIWILGDDTLTLQKQLHDWFDPENETPGAFVITDKAGTNTRYVNALCQNMQPVPNTKGRKWIVTLTVHGDIRWRESTPTTSTWNITASGQTKALTNNGQDDAYPVLTITPTSGKTGGYSYKRFVAVRWNADYSTMNYPIDICNDSFNTSTLVSGGKMQADGDDLRVIVDGKEVDRWLDGINTTTTKVWCNLNYRYKYETTLSSAIISGDTTIPIEGVVDDLASMPGSGGILMIDSELIVYNGYTAEPLQFTGCTRGAKGTTAASHSAGATVIWIQHDIWILYGNSSATARTVDSNYEPIFVLASSTNTSWDYDSFRQDTKPTRPGSWEKEVVTGSPVFYGGNHGASADPYVEMGINCNIPIIREGAYIISNLCGITAANFQNGEKYTTYIPGWMAIISARPLGSSTYNLEYSVPAPSASSTWESWSQNITLIATSDTVRMYLGTFLVMTQNQVEVADVTLTLSSSTTPTITLGSEQGNYDLDCTINNNTTGEGIQIDMDMALNQDLEVDTDAKTLIYLLDNSTQLSALSLTPGVRKQWLRLQPGSNTIAFTDTGTNGMTIDFSWEERHYQ